MNKKTRLLLTVILTLTVATTISAQPRRGQRTAFKTDTVMAHDPVMAYEDGKYYLLATAWA